MVEYEVKIDKVKLWKRVIFERVYYLLLSLMIIPILKGIQWASSSGYRKFDINITKWSIILISIVWIIILITWWLGELFVDSLEYSITSDKLQMKYQTITRTIDSARLQVINSININQTLFDKIFNHFSLEVCYGMGEGHYWGFYYLSEEESNRLMGIIKPTGNNVLIK